MKMTITTRMVIELYIANEYTLSSGHSPYSGAMRPRTTICLHRSWLVNRGFGLLSNSLILNMASYRLRIKLALVHFSVFVECRVRE